MYDLITEVSTKTHDHTVKYEFSIFGNYRPAIMYPNDLASPEEFPEVEVEKVYLQICDKVWIEVDHDIFYDWAKDNEELFFEEVAGYET